MRAVDTIELRQNIEAKAAACGTSASMVWSGWAITDLNAGGLIRGRYIQDLRNNLKLFYSPLAIGRPTAPIFDDDPIVTGGILLLSEHPTSPSCAMHLVMHNAAEI